MAGYAGIINSYTGKVAFSPDPQIFDFYYLEKVIGFLLMLNFNKFMFQFLFISFEKNGSSITTLLNFLSNSLLNVNYSMDYKALTGYYIMGELVSGRWVLGMVLLTIGVVLIATDKKHK